MTDSRRTRARRPHVQLHRDELGRVDRRLDGTRGGKPLRGTSGALKRPPLLPMCFPADFGGGREAGKYLKLLEPTGGLEPPTC